MSLPNVFIVGAQKSASTSVLRWLDSFKSVDSGYLKEIGLLAFDDTEVFPDAFSYSPSLANKLTWSQNRDEILDIYGEFFGDRDDAEVIVDASVIYLPSLVAAKRIAEIQPDAKIIILLREPISRSESALAHHVQRLSPLPDLQDLTLENDPLGILRFSDYFPQVKRFCDVFPREQIFARTFEQFCREGDSLLSELSEFLNIGVKNQQVVAEKRNPSLYPRLDGRLMLQLLEKKGRFMKDRNVKAINLDGLYWLREYRQKSADPLAKPWKRRLRRRLERMVFTSNKRHRVRLPDSTRKKYQDYFESQREGLAAIIPDANISHWWCERE